MFPIRDSRGRVIAFGGRAFGDEKPKYLNSPETPVFHKSQELYGLYEAKQNTPTLDHIIVVEGYMDVIVLAQNGVTNSVATLGTSVNSQHIQKLFKLVSKITLCFDGDKAGRSAAIRGLEASLSVMQDNKQVRFLFLPEGEDPDSLIRKEGQERFLNRLDDSSSMAHVLFDHARKEVTLADEEGEAQFAQNAMRHIQNMPECTLKSILVKQLAEQSGINAESLSSNTQKPKYRSNQTEADPNNIEHYNGTPPHYDEPPGYYDDSSYEPYNPTQESNSHYKKEPYSQAFKNKKNVNGKAFSKKSADNEAHFNFPRMSSLPALSQIGNATLCLLLHPHIASDIDVSDPLLRQPDQDVQLFSKVWRYFHKYPEKNTGNLLGNWNNSENYDAILYLLNHPDAHTKSKISNAKQEVRDVIERMEENLGRNASSQRLKNQGNETIKDNDSRTELRQWMEQMRKKKRP
ncbi:toprim domain-containing protein [Marinomonas sp. 15G1-11]|uniref:Toprim domain-containing protein n=2 Tax=Marinomonas phaeophyticola TaxID=3004091 RepID=A0ABT4JS54_9GAMM|nr:toprim domain-containing protein [Marinomonas sp. 15G1-11]